MKKNNKVILISLVLAAALLLPKEHLPLLSSLHWKIYDKLLDVKHRGSRLPSAIKDIVLVTIDNRTLQKMDKRWPYPRSDFAGVVRNLKKAGARVIGFDFIFFGQTTKEEDILLKETFEEGRRVILAASVGEKDSIILSTVPGLSDRVPVGVISKLQDTDGVTRRNLTYLVDADNPGKGILSWEMEVLKIAKGFRRISLRDAGSMIYFQNETDGEWEIPEGADAPLQSYKQERWAIPVDSGTKSSLIHYMAHTTDFKRLSFYDVLKGDFDPEDVKDKIILVGFLSSLFQDIHPTPIGWLPGITLNANAFLTFYMHSFLKKAPGYAEALVVFMGVFVSTLAVLKHTRAKAAFLIGSEVFLFFVLSYILLERGYIWNYSVFPIAAILCPFAGARIYAFTNKLIAKK